jgi:hypothetical protein
MRLSGDDKMVRDPSALTRDTAQYTGKPLRDLDNRDGYSWSMSDLVDGKEMAKGGKVKKVVPVKKVLKAKRKGR